jgi:hypothetical protein
MRTAEKISTGNEKLATPSDRFDLPNLQSAPALQDGVCLILLYFLQQLTDFRCGHRNDLDTAPFRLR